ncbi:MAG: hypothetical protein LBG25_04680, partial [Spirochaetaceae bacterium]|nr:hypothetical protein [Spirochaetaceae bacterium]
MKKGLVFVLIAVVSAAFLVVGCKQGTDSGSTTSVRIGGRLVDIAVTTEADLVVALDNADYQVIGVTGDEDDNGFYGATKTSLQVVTEIPADKTVVLYRKFKPGRTLEVKGTLIVEGNGNLVTTHGTAEVEVTSGRIEVINGTITTDVTEAIHGVPVTQEIFGTSKVQFAGGTLSIGDPLSTFEKVKTIFGWVPHGTVEIAEVTEAVKPSDVAAVPTTSVRRLTITATVPVAGSGDTVGAL